MKNKVLIKAVLKLFFLVAVSSVSAQDTTGIKSLPPVTVKSSTKKIPDRIWKSFSSYFTYPENPRWFKANKNYLVKFMIYNEENRALFTKRGNLVYHISYGYEKNLPEDLRNQVKASYNGYEITRAIKVTESNRIIWVVNLEKENELALIRIEGDEIEEIQRLRSP